MFLQKCRVYCGGWIQTKSILAACVGIILCFYWNTGRVLAEEDVSSEFLSQEENFAARYENANPKEASPWGGELEGPSDDAAQADVSDVLEWMSEAFKDDEGNQRDTHSKGIENDLIAEDGLSSSPEEEGAHFLRVEKTKTSADSTLLATRVLLPEKKAQKKGNQWRTGSGRFSLWEEPERPHRNSRRISLSESPKEMTLGKPLFVSKILKRGIKISSVVRAANMVAWGEEEEAHSELFEICSACGGLFYNNTVKGYQPRKFCLWDHWSNELERLYPTLRSELSGESGRVMKLFRSSFWAASRVVGIPIAGNAATNTLTTLFVVGLRRLIREVNKQRYNGEDVNIGRALNEVLRAHKSLREPLLTAFLQVTGTGCKAGVPYSDRAIEDYGSAAPDMHSIIRNPLLQYLSDNPFESLAWVPPALPKRISVTISPELPENQQHEEWRLPLYRLWNLLWSQISETYRLDHLWRWMKTLDATELFPGWEVKAVGTALFTEHRPAAYANGAWRFAHIDPETLELERDSNGRYKNPFALNRVSTNTLGGNSPSAPKEDQLLLSGLSSKRESGTQTVSSNNDPESEDRKKRIHPLSWALGLGLKHLKTHGLKFNPFARRSPSSLDNTFESGNQKSPGGLEYGTPEVSHNELEFERTQESNRSIFERTRDSISRTGVNDSDTSEKDHFFPAGFSGNVTPNLSFNNDRRNEDANNRGQPVSLLASVLMHLKNQSQKLNSFSRHPFSFFRKTWDVSGRKFLDHLESSISEAYSDKGKFDATSDRDTSEKAPESPTDLHSKSNKSMSMLGSVLKSLNDQSQRFNPLSRRPSVEESSGQKESESTRDSSGSPSGRTQEFVSSPAVSGIDSSCDSGEDSSDSGCSDVEVIREGSAVSYIRRGVMLKIHKSVCGEVPTFDYIEETPYAVLLTPLQDTLEWANITAQNIPQSGKDQPTADKLKSLGWSTADAVWVFRPTTLPKLWAINRLVTPLRRQILLSDHPKAKMHRGYNYLFHTTLLILMNEFIAALANYPDTQARESQRRKSKRDYSDLAKKFVARTGAKPFTVVFTGLSMGGGMAGISAIYFARQMKSRGLDKHLRVMCVAFGTPSWGTPEMYSSFDELGIIWNEVWAAQDPVPEFLAGEDIVGLAYDRRQTVLHSSDWGHVQLSSPFSFDGSRWLKGVDEASWWRRIFTWLLDLHKVSVLPLNPKIAHQHVYTASLSLMSGIYKHAGWMSHLAVPWLPMKKLEVTTFPEAMQDLARVHEEVLGSMNRTPEASP